MRCLAVAAFALLAACSSLTNYERQGPVGASPGPVPAGDTYVVRPGDTLYSIAWRRGLDPVAVAAWNNLRNPDRIFVGQRLRLTPAAGATTAASRGATGAASGGASSAGAAPTTASSSGSVARPGAGSPAPAAPARTASTAAPQWQWPTPGRIVSRFGASGALATGVAIAGSVGQDIVAAADGRVEYVGVGLVEYGQLIIISHGDTWISAYGYNDAVFVAEKETVRRGQKIAEMGTGPGRQPRLHFEIRRYGEAVDPMPLLPPTR